MTDDERKESIGRIADIFLLSMETVAENFAAVVAGEKRVALVPRKHAKVKAGPVYEWRLVSAPTPAALRAEAAAERVADGGSVASEMRREGFDPKELDELAASVGTDAAAAVIPPDDPELNIDNDLGDVCCNGGPWWGHDENCPHAVAPPGYDPDEENDAGHKARFRKHW